MPDRARRPLLLMLASATLLAIGGCPPRGDARLPEATPAMAGAARTTWPDATVEQLARGRATMAAHCNACHGMPAPASESAKEWPDIVKRMARKAKLDQAQRDDLLRYVLAAHNLR